MLPNFLQGRWQTGRAAGAVLYDPVLGEEFVRVSADGPDLAAGFAFAHNNGGAALRALTHRERGELLGNIVKVLFQNREAYYAIATANSGTVRNDSALDIDGALYTLGAYSALGDRLGGDAGQLAAGR